MLSIWIAFLAILFSALAPTVSHALAAANPIANLQMCTADGGDGTKAPADLKHGMVHCAFCTIHGGDDGLLSPPAVTLAVLAGRDAYPPLFYTAPHPLSAWSVANPRAPPVLA